MPLISSETIRQSFANYLSGQGYFDHDKMRETILIRDGHYCGRRLHGSGHSLVWFVEENEIKLYGTDGALIWATDAETFTSYVPSVRRAA